MAERRKLPDTRQSKIHKIRVEDTWQDLGLYITTGFYDDGILGEVFVSVGKQGSTLQGMLDGWAKLLSLSLQYGVPLEDIAEKFMGDSFPPSGLTSDGEKCSSLLDCVMAYLLSPSRSRVKA